MIKDNKKKILISTCISDSTRHRVLQNNRRRRRGENEHCETNLKHHTVSYITLCLPTTNATTRTNNLYLYCYYYNIVCLPKFAERRTSCARCIKYEYGMILLLLLSPERGGIGGIRKNYVCTFGRRETVTK